MDLALTFFMQIASKNETCDVSRIKLNLLCGSTLKPSWIKKVSSGYNNNKLKIRIFPFIIIMCLGRCLHSPSALFPLFLRHTKILLSDKAIRVSIGSLLFMVEFGDAD